MKIFKTRCVKAVGASLMALTIAEVAAAQTPAPVKAPEVVAAADDAGAIVVTGYRGSLRASIGDKRDASVQIDAITAEDIADFPDNNLAESLQRLPGVSVDRDNGEGRSITVRGTPARRATWMP